MHDPEANTAPRRESGTIQSVQLFLFYSSFLPFSIDVEVFLFKSLSKASAHQENLRGKKEQGNSSIWTKINRVFGRILVEQTDHCLFTH
jgi:hypothetical protein